ncbi:MAG: glycosyltransferase WbpL [Actinomycetota bacterium]|jgi:UDP-N-acetylmuramyl pentapeptide phosphotransferase/UDP-N-acetylglucosamine-1-phosphate transferase|nr:glycosyltransferase WbpL [Actinomycetota bacterium]
MLIPALVAGGLVLAISPALLVGLRRLGVLDVPTQRSSHAEPTPRGGGVAVAIGAVSGLVTATSVPSRPATGILLAACGLGLFGLLDDLVDVAALWRLLFQVAAAAFAANWLVAASSPSAIFHLALICLVTLWLVSYVNAFNFMDGINGISVVQTVVAGGAWAVVAEVRHIPLLGTLGVVAAAAAVGFAPFNFPRARMFLGDSGSYFVGAWLAAVVVIGLRAGVPPEAMVAPLALYLADTGSTLLRRVWRHQPWHSAHRDHAYQRLVDDGWTHATTTFAVGLLLVVVSGLGLLSLTDSPALRAAGDAAGLAVLGAYLAAPEWVGRRRSRTRVALS